MSGDVTVWRIVADTPAYEAHDLSGAGAERSGGRWNRPRMPLVYASTTRALACLETIVHLDRDVSLPLNRYLVRISIPGSVWKSRAVCDPARLAGWDAVPEGRVSLDWGAAWIASADSAVAEVPSVIVPEETNVLINPAHPDAATLAAIKMRPWSYDFRLQDKPSAELKLRPTASRPELQFRP